jgi:hypothetical protein
MNRNVTRSTKIIAAVGAMALSAACGGGLPSFGADLGVQSGPMGEIRVPYTSVISYFGYVEPGAAGDEVVDGKKMFYLYLWVPIVAPEIGVRMISPVANLATPAEADFVDAAFKEKGATDTTNYFDTWVRLERCVDIINPEDIEKPCGSWARFGDNDDTGELPAQPSGSKYNSLMRHTSDVNDPLKALVRGLYRIGFTTYKVGEVQGSFLAQVGAPIDLPGTVIARNPAAVVAAIKALEAPAAAPAEGGGEAAPAN